MFDKTMLPKHIKKEYKDYTDFLLTEESTVQQIANFQKQVNDVFEKNIDNLNNDEIVKAIYKIRDNDVKKVSQVKNSFIYGTRYNAGLKHSNYGGYHTRDISHLEELNDL